MLLPTFGKVPNPATEFAIPELNILVFGDGIRFEAIGPKGRIWLSDRVSWDGMRDLTVDELVLKGTAWDIGDQWIPFELDLLDGKFAGGSYSGPLNWMDP